MFTSLTLGVSVIDNIQLSDLIIVDDFPDQYTIKHDVLKTEERIVIGVYGSEKEAIIIAEAWLNKRFPNSWMIHPDTIDKPVDMFYVRWYCPLNWSDDKSQLYPILRIWTASPEMIL